MRGVGSDYNERLLAGIASKTKEFFEHLDNLAKMLALVKKMIFKYKRISTKNVKLFIKIPLGIGVHVYIRLAYSTRGGIEIEVGDVCEGKMIRHSKGGS